MIFILRAMALALSAVLFAETAAPADQPSPKLVSQGLSGYISMEVAVSPEQYGYGVSLYAAAWPLVAHPLRNFQIGLASIWIVPENRKIHVPLLPTGTFARDHWPERGPSYRDVFQTIEGGLGFWASTRFGSPIAKFRMNGTPDGYNHEISSPGWGFGQPRALQPDAMGIAQLSAHLLVPPDGLTFHDGTIGELLGYAWMALPLTEAKATMAGQPIPTGNQCWTLFLNAADFKGPVAFYTPTTWSRISRRHPPALQRGLDARPGLVTGGAIEINTVPRYVSTVGGVTYHKIPRLQFPVDQHGRTVLIHNLTHYSKAALYTPVQRWLAGGEMPSGRFDPQGAVVPACRARPLSVRQGERHLPIHGCENWVQTATFGKSTFGLQWKPAALGPWTDKFRRGIFPEYTEQKGKEITAVASNAVPDTSGLKAARFPAASAGASYTSPAGGDNCWHKPGPKAGPFQAKLTDGSVVTYYWYRFVDQPALQNAALSAGEQRRLQAIVEKIHRHWTSDKEYIPPPILGTLATLDRALLVTPPRGLEVGYVPIAVRQGLAPR